MAGLDRKPVEIRCSTTLYIDSTGIQQGVYFDDSKICDLEEDDGELKCKEFDDDDNGDDHDD